MRIQILGGGNNQLNAVLRAREKGHEVVLTDYYKDAVARPYADFNEVVSTFDVAGNLAVGRKYQVDGIMTVGTDQPVYTVAAVARELNLPRLLEVEVAEAVTNKKKMKKIFNQQGIPTVAHRFVSEGALDLKNLRFPVVLKPVDSQGQRGVFKLDSQEEVIDHLPQTLSFSREKTALVEEYYPSDEITVSAWVEAKKARILTITDRQTIDFKKHIGICFAHQFPSAYRGQEDLIKALIDKIATSFLIENGPLYVQLLVGKAGILVNEVAGRIGGAYEDIFIPYLTGFDILGQLIDESLGLKRSVKINDCLNKHLSVQLFFARPGKVKSLTPRDQLKNLPGVIGAGYNICEKQKIEQINNATARAGYLIVSGENQVDLKEKLTSVFDQLKIIDENGENLLIQF